jgi:5-methylcytosine-specific restriction endonuclease McrA
VSFQKFYAPALRPWLLRGVEPDWLRKHPRRTYVVGRILSRPSWVSNEQLDPIHAEAKRLTVETGVRHVVDHIVPINHPYVCGLTVPWNLQVITWQQNASKSGYWNPWQLELDLG